MKRIFLIGFQLLAFQIGFAQTKTQLNASELKERISVALAGFHNSNNQKLSNFCGRGIILIKINAVRETLDIDLSKDSSTVIVNFLKAALNPLQHDKAFLQIIKNSHRIIILPFIYNFESACSTGLKQTTEEGQKSMVNYMLAMDNLYNTVVDMLIFSDGKTDALDCIFLSPYLAGAKS